MIPLWPFIRVCLLLVIVAVIWAILITRERNPK